MDDLKLYGKSENEIKRLVSTADVFSQDTGMAFGTKQCGMIIINRVKVKSTSKCICEFKVFFKLVFIAAQAFERTFL